jgi:hypothetical protein
LISRLFQRSSQESLDVDFVFNEQKAHKWILVHISHIYMGKPHDEKKAAALQQPINEHIVMKSSAHCHAR